MARMLLLLSTFALLVHSLSATSDYIPKGSQDGMYMATADNTLIYMGPHNETLLTEYNTLTASATQRKERTINRRTGEGVFCDASSKTEMAEDDIVNARLFMAAWFVDNGCFNSKSIVSVYGGAASFACNYQSQTCQTDSGYIEDGEAIDDDCGETRGGWYGHGIPIATHLAALLLATLTVSRGSLLDVDTWHLRERMKQFYYYFVSFCVS